MQPQFDNLALILYGAGGHGKVVLDAAVSRGFAVQKVIDDAPCDNSLLGTPLMAASQVDWAGLAGVNFVVTIGDNAMRSAISQRLLQAQGTPVNIIHRSAIVSPFARMGLGNVVLANAVINPGAVIGDNCIINTSATIDHDCVVESHAHICPGVHLAGGVRVGEGTMIGIGSSCIPGVKIGEWAVIGAGSVLVKNIPKRVVAFGSPANVRRSLPEHRDNEGSRI